ncbi:armadillo repeat-containing protein 5-like [Pollicipes pollicipes]|uniref:armadillo repeat-containing protein 5-like n=1 Tax=Pollicipes pollicipes TaxID=41117 RepID=UPI00188525F3|nr:armadillo repeat-containing protein 5-like [Pollicipes pollicipes]
MGRLDTKAAIARLAAQPDRDQLLATLAEVRRRVIATRPGLERFVELGGLAELTRLLREPQPADVFNLVLSILGNCTTRPAGRQHFVRHGGLHAVLNVIQIVADPHVANRGCRTLANLAQEPSLCRTLHQEDTLDVVAALLAAEPGQAPPSDHLRITIFRLWRNMADTSSHQRRLLRTECLVTVAAGLGSGNGQLAREALKTLAHFADQAARETGAQMQQCSEALPALLRLCGAGASPDPQLGSAALRLVLVLARESSLRPPLGQLGLLQMLYDGARRRDERPGQGGGQEAGQGTDEKPGQGADQQPDQGADQKSSQVRQPAAGTVPDSDLEDGASEVVSVSSLANRSCLVSALCLFCWESVNRARLRALGCLPWLVSLLGSEREPEPLRRRVLHALFQFVYDEAGFAQMKAAGLLEVLVRRLQALVSGWRDGSPERAERPSSPGTFRADSPTYQQVEREIAAYLRQVRAAGEPPERLYKSFSPTDSLASSPQCSPDGSPPSWAGPGSPASSLASSRLSASTSPDGSRFSPFALSGGSEFSPSASPGSSQFSPPAMPGGSRLSPDASLGGSQFSPPVWPGGSRWSPPAPRKGPRYSPAASPPAESPGGAAKRCPSADCAALLDYLRHAPRPQARASRILARLCRNPSCFRSLVRQRLAWLCVSRLSAAQAELPLDALRAVAETGYGQGVLESLLELGDAEAMAAVTTAAIVVRLQTSLRRLLLRRRGLELLLTAAGGGGEWAEPAAGALLALGEHLVPAWPAAPPAAPPQPCLYLADPGPTDLTLVLSDGEEEGDTLRADLRAAVTQLLEPGGC